MQSFRNLIKPAVGVLLIHFIFVSYRLIPVLYDFEPLTFIIPMGELILVFILLNGAKYRIIRTLAALIILSFLFFFLFGELFYRIFYLERFDMLSDMQLIPNFLVMLLPENILPKRIIKVSAVGITILTTLLFALFILVNIRKLAGSKLFYSGKRVHIISILTAVLLILIFPSASPLYQTVSMAGGDYFSQLLSAEPSIEQIPAKPAILEEDLPESVPVVKEPEWTYAGIKDSDIHFAVVESYGAVLFQNEVYKDFILQVYDELQPRLDSDGWIVKSGFVLSPAFGGRSWLADATLLTGEQIVNQRIFDERLSVGEPAFFLEEMKKAGYLSYYVAPGSTHASPEWKKAYPFDQYLLRADFGYEGPNIAFGTMSDQFTYNHFKMNFLKDDQKEFAFYLLVSSHTPFERIPVYKDDWDFSLNGREYENGYIQYFENNWLYGNELAEGYLEGIGYSLETTIRYLTDILTGKQFMLVIGDHQPRKPVSGPDPGYPVIFHIIFPEGSNIRFPESWNLNNGLIPPELPVNYNDIPEMAAIPFLIEQLIK